MTLLEFVKAFREPATDDALWHEISQMRQWAECPDLPPSLAELQRGLRLLKSAGKVKEEWPPGATRGLWSGVIQAVKPVAKQGALFAQ